MTNLTVLLSYLRALYQMYQHMHWKAEGPNYYSDHLLYQRLYEGVEDELDGVAEKIIGLHNDPHMIDSITDSATAAQAVEMLMEDRHDPETFQKTAIRAERILLKLIKQLMEEDTTDGLEDMLQGLANKHEEHLYLLQQRNRSAAVISRLTKIASDLDTKGLYSEADEIDKVIKSLIERVGLVSEAKKVKKTPPGKWWNKMVKEVKKNNKKLDEEAINAIVGDIWFNNLSSSKRTELGKKYKKKG